MTDKPKNRNASSLSSRTDGRDDEADVRLPDGGALEGAAGGTSCGGGCCRRRGEPRGKLYCHDWLADIPGGFTASDIVEVQFKNTRKGYYRNAANLSLKMGDIVAVEANPGHDIGEVTLTGRLVEMQLRKANVKPDTEYKRIFRLARPADIEKWEEAKAKENDTMIRARKIAENLHLNMKIGDVEYQGDGNKAIFYYIADERVDFRQLIKVLADAFKVRIEMKQIGARQEAGRIGGIGPCDRPLCCSTWMTSFVSVGTAAARFQDLSLNPQKLAGQCAKLKCCLNFEVDVYAESVKKLPRKDVTLETADGTYYHFKTDIFKKEITYSTDKSVPANLVTISAKRAFEVIALNKKGEKPPTLLPEGAKKPDEKKVVDLVEQESLTRFDKAKKKNKKRKPAADKTRKNVDVEAAKPVADGGNDKGSEPKPTKPAAEGGSRRNRNRNRNNKNQGGNGSQPQDNK